VVSRAWRFAASRPAWTAGWLAALVLAAGCGEEDVTGTDGGGGNGNHNQGPLTVFDIALRPQAITRGSSLAGPIPNPSLGTYYLTAFYRGGTADAVFTWDPDPALGTVEPKTITLGTTDAPVQLHNDGLTPLGLYPIRVTGTSNGVSSSFQRQFAVVEHNWMKHERTTISNPNDPPASLVLDPVYAPRPDGGDDILFVVFPNAAAVDLWSIQADRPYLEAAQAPVTSLFLPPTCDTPTPCDCTTSHCDAPCPFGTIDAQRRPPPQEFGPDLSPAALGRDEILFASEMDVHFQLRACARNKDAVPFSLWVVKRPTFLNTFRARVLTIDVRYDSLGGSYYRAWNYQQPRWDPSATAGPAARIAFISDRGRARDIWLADLMDMNGDGQSDSLMNFRELTHVGGVTSFDWHPNGQSLYFIKDGVDAIQHVGVDGSSMANLTFARHDSLITGFASVSVFARESTLLTFEASSENRVNLYLYDEAQDNLVRLNPFGFPVTQHLFPRWHPTRKEIVYVSDYSVARWVQGDPSPVGSPSFLGQLRTQYPSVWTVRLEDRPNP
jgi:hypothetical protein